MSDKNSLDKSKINILLLEGIHNNAEKSFMADGYTNIQTFKKSLVGDELTEALANAHFLGIRSRT